MCVRLISARCELRFGKALTLPKGGCSNKGKFPLRSYPTGKNQPAGLSLRLTERPGVTMQGLLTCSGALTPDENVLSALTTKTNVLGNISELLIELVCCVAASEPARSELSSKITAARLG